MLPLNPAQAQGLFTFVSSITMTLTPVASPDLSDALVYLDSPPAPIAQEVILSVPFSSQAPEANWKQPYADACEETAILMIDRFYKGNRENKIEIQEADEAILNILKIKEAEFGPSYDESLTRMDKMVDLINSNWTAEIKESPTLEEIKEELNEGRPIILPVAYFPNPNYRSPLDYHVFVLTGYSEERNTFIINDPGTQYGDGMEFEIPVVMEKIHDLNPEDYEAGPKRALFTKPNN